MNPLAPVIKCMPIHPFIHLSISLSHYSAIYLSVHPSIHPCIYLSIHSTSYSSIQPSISLCICSPLQHHPFVHSFIHPFISSSAHQFIQPASQPCIHSFIQFKLIKIWLAFLHDTIQYIFIWVVNNNLCNKFYKPSSVSMHMKGIMRFLSQWSWGLVFYRTLSWAGRLPEFICKIQWYLHICSFCRFTWLLS